MKRTKKAMAGAGVLAGIMLITGAIAFMSDSDNSVNKFSFVDEDNNQSLDIALKESNWNEEDGQLIEYGTPVAKNPTIKNIGEKEVYAFATVILPAKSVAVQNIKGELIDVDGTALSSADVAANFTRGVANNISANDAAQTSDETEILGAYRVATTAEIADEFKEAGSVEGFKRIEGDYYVALKFGDDVPSTVYFLLNDTATLGTEADAAVATLTTAQLDDIDHGKEVKDINGLKLNGVVTNNGTEDVIVDANGDEIKADDSYYTTKEGKIYKQLTVGEDSPPIDKESNDVAPHTFAKNDKYYKVTTAKGTQYYTTVDTGDLLLKDTLDTTTGVSNTLGHQFMFKYVPNGAPIRELYTLEEDNAGDADREINVEGIWSPVDDKADGNSVYTRVDAETETDPAEEDFSNNISDVDAGWVEITNELGDATIYVDGDQIYSAHVFYYNTALTGGSETTPVFDYAEIINLADGQIDREDDMNIYVSGYAIQTAGLEDAIEAATDEKEAALTANSGKKKSDTDWTSSPLTSEEEGKVIWDIMTNSQDQDSFDLFSVVKNSNSEYKTNNILAAKEDLN